MKWRHKTGPWLCFKGNDAFMATLSVYSHRPCEWSRGMRKSSYNCLQILINPTTSCCNNLLLRHTRIWSQHKMEGLGSSCSTKKLKLAVKWLRNIWVHMNGATHCSDFPTFLLVTWIRVAGGQVFELTSTKSSSVHTIIGEV